MYSRDTEDGFVPNKQVYDLNADWDDPYDRRPEARNVGRFSTKFRVKIYVETPRGTLVGPGIVNDLSISGMCLVTKHELKRGQRITVKIPTAVCPDSMGMPRAFTGQADTVRIKNLGENRSLVALKFLPELSENMEFVVFLDYLSSIASVMTSP